MFGVKPRVHTAVGCSAGAGAWWRIPSDHLPTGAEVQGPGGTLRFVSWNVLSTEFRVQNLEEQGLRGSLPWQLYDIAALPLNASDGTGDDPVVRLRGLPWKATSREIIDFFGDLCVVPNGVHLVPNPDGRPSGDAFVEFETHGDAVQSLQKHKKHLGPRYVEVYKSTRQEMATKVNGRSVPPIGSKRDALVLVTLELLIRPGAHQAAVLVLQEATPGLLAALEPLLESEGWAVGPGVYSSQQNGGSTSHNQDTVLLYRTAALKLESIELHDDVFSDGKKLVAATLVPIGAACAGSERAAETTRKVRVVACKIKGTPPVKPTKDGLWISRAVKEWASFMARCCPVGATHADADVMTVCMGDFNFLEPEVLDACRQAGVALAPCPHAAATDAYPTNPNPAPLRLSERGFHGPAFGPKRIDHVLVDVPSATTGQIALLPPDHLIPGLSAAVEVLRCSGGSDVPTWAADKPPPGPMPPWEMSPNEAIGVVLSWKHLIATACDSKAFEQGVARGLGSEDRVLKAEGAQQPRLYPCPEPETEPVLLAVAQGRVPSEEGTRRPRRPLCDGAFVDLEAARGQPDDVPFANVL